MKSVSSSQATNQLLAALPAADWDQLHPGLSWVQMSQGTVLHEAGDVLRHVYFPVTSVVSLVSTLQNGSAMEVASVGSEGIVGVCAFMGAERTHTAAVVQCAGYGWRLAAATIAELARGSVGLMQPLLRYTQALATTLAQTAACNRHHALEQQLCRWLLVNLDHRGDHELLVTQDRIGSMLGVRRESVTASALKLQKADLIHCSRGRIHILNRAGLESRSCECYAVVRLAHERLLDGPAHTAAGRWAAQDLQAA